MHESYDRFLFKSSSLINLNDSLFLLRDARVLNKRLYFSSSDRSPFLTCNRRVPRVEGVLYWEGMMYILLRPTNLVTKKGCWHLFTLDPYGLLKMYEVITCNKEIADSSLSQSKNRPERGKGLVASQIWWWFTNVPQKSEYVSIICNFHFACNW